MFQSVNGLVKGFVVIRRLFQVSRLGNKKRLINDLVLGGK